MWGGPSCDPEQFVDRVAGCIDRHGLLSPGAKVLVAVSGGADSVAALFTLSELAGRPERRYALHVAHLDHGLRPDSAEDGRFVADLAAEMGLPVTVERIDVAPGAGRSIETAARDVRYAFLKKAATQAGCEAIATAHHAGDNVETVLHRILRGTGIKGLRGIQPKRTFDDDTDLQLIRPMLDVTAADAEAYLGARQARWRTDPTNLDMRHTRNRIRHELLPMLRRFNGRVDESIARLATAATWAAELLDDLGDATLADVILEESADGVVLNRRELADKGHPLAAQTIRAALGRMAAPMGRIGMDHIQRVLELLDDDGPGGRVELPAGLVVCRQRDRLIFRMGASATPDRIAPHPCEIAWPGCTELSGRAKLSVELADGGQVELAGFLADKPPACEMIDADAVTGRVIARRWRQGDRFDPLGGPGHQKLSDFFGSARITADARQAAWVIQDDRGILWVAPYRIAHRVRVTEATRRVARVKLLGGPS